MDSTTAVIAQEECAQLLLDGTQGRDHWENLGGWRILARPAWIGRKKIGAYSDNVCFEKTARWLLLVAPPPEMNRPVPVGTTPGSETWR